MTGQPLTTAGSEPRSKGEAVTTTEHTPSRNCYLRGCRAPGCVLASTRYTKQLRLEHQRGHYRMTDATQVRDHIKRLTAAGWTQQQISAACGIPSANIHKLHVAAQQKIASWRAAAILAVPVTPAPANPRRVDATGSRRRLQALRVLGHRRYDLAAELDTTPDRVKHITIGAARWVTPQEAAAIARLYRRLSTVPGPCKQTAGLARNKGWHGPLAWDDIDDPAAKPEGARKSRAKAGNKRGIADVSRVAELTAAGRSAQQIADELGCHKRSVTRARRRAEMEVAA
jgi:transcriptional regulator